MHQQQVSTRHRILQRRHIRTLVACAVLASVLSGCGISDEAPILTLLNLRKPTDNPDLPADGNRYVYSPTKAKRSKRDLEKQLRDERNDTGELNQAAETLKQEIGALRAEQSRQTDILNSKTSSTPEKRKAQERKRALAVKIKDLQSRLDRMHRIAS
jgi:predicted RNase H-like nuclease (RuvC/YqgF family)